MRMSYITRYRDPRSSSTVCESRTGSELQIAVLRFYADLAMDNLTHVQYRVVTRLAPSPLPSTDLALLQARHASDWEGRIPSTSCKTLYKSEDEHRRPFSPSRCPSIQPWLELSICCRPSSLLSPS